MGLLDGILGKKCCSICDKPVNVMNYRKLKDGNCCKECDAKLSDWFTERGKATVDDIKYQVECRNQNIMKVQNFEVTRIIGNDTKVYFDENKFQFIISSAKDYKAGNPDVINFLEVVRCEIDVKETKKEMKYKDSTGESKSFNPPCYACSYDFFMEMSVKIPYISNIRFKINKKPIDNDQELCINLQQGGLLGNLLDVVMPAKSNNGKTSNADEVRNCAEYRKCDEIGNEIRDILLYRYRNVMKEIDENTHRNVMKETDEKLKRIICPWCDSAIDLDRNGYCDYCGGKLNVD